MATTTLDDEPAAPASSLKAHDVIYIFFRHKGKILLCAAAGLIAAGLVWISQPPVFQSQAKLLVRYVLDQSTVDQMDTQLRMPGSSAGDTIINSEVEIITSSDLAAQVAEVVGPQNIVPGATGPAGKAAAARAIVRGLEAVGLRGSNIIRVSYQNADPRLAQSVLETLVERYLAKHLEVHRSIGAFDAVSQEADQLRARLRQTEEDLIRSKERVGIPGITSLLDSTANLNAEMRQSREAILAAEAELAGQEARIKEIDKWLAGADAKQAESSTAGSKDEIVQYQALVSRLTKLREEELDLLSKYTAGNQQVQLNQTEIKRVETERRRMEAKYPALAATVQDSSSAQRLQLELVSERAKAASIQARMHALEQARQKLEESANRQAEMRSQIAQLERKKAIEEANYKYFQESLEKARVDETLDPSKMPNINVVQRPSSPSRVTSDLKKILLGLAGGGLGLGLAIAFLIELLLDRSIKRSIELEHRMGIPLMFSIPFIGGGRRLRSRSSNPAAALRLPAKKEIAPWEPEHFIRPFAEAIRDRLVLYFQLHRVMRKPKLIAVTGVEKNAGASTIAASLSAALSETGDGKVLHVDMNIGRPEAHPFLEGRRVQSLTEVLELRNGARQAEAPNLYVAAPKTGHNGSSTQLVPKRFYDLLPQLKASDFDYIIFDMPTLEESSATLAMAGSMDQVLLVVEAEKTTRDAVRNHFAELLAARAKVSCILNKTRSYAPKTLENAA